jgi:IS5 family transposase
MDRCWLKGSEGDAPHAVLCAAGFNIRWLLRAIARQAAKAISLALSLVTLYAGFAVLVVARTLTTPTAGSAIGCDA